jgi:hypothetical protein
VKVGPGEYHFSPSGYYHPRGAKLHDLDELDSMNAKFDLGRITVKDDAAYFLALAGQDATFFIEKHAAGDWGEEDAAGNEQGLREGSMVLSRYRTLWGHPILVFTSLGKAETFLFCPPTLVNHVPLFDCTEWREPGDKPLYGPDGLPNPELFWHPTPSENAQPQEEVPMQQPKGQGGKIIVQEKARGYVVFSPENLLEIPEQFPVHLSLTFDRWLKANPGLHIRTVLPIVDNGKTVILHVWYEGQLTGKQ